MDDSELTVLYVSLKLTHMTYIAQHIIGPLILHWPKCLQEVLNCSKVQGLGIFRKMRKLGIKKQVGRTLGEELGFESTLELYHYAVSCSF